MGRDVQLAEKAATGLLRAVCDFQVGAAVAPVAPSERNREVVERCRFEEWVEDLKAQYRAAIAESDASAAGAASDAPESAAEDAELLHRIDRLKLEVRECALERAREADLVSRIRNTAVLSAAVFPDDAGAELVPLTAKEAQAVAARVQRRDERSTELLELNAELRQASRDLDALRAENAALMHDNRAAMRELKALRDASASAPSQLSGDADAAAASGLKRERSVNVILRNLFQAVIVGSGVDWASDAELLETMMGLAEPYEG